MAGFLYHIPDVTPDDVTPEEIARRGMDTALRDVLRKWRPRHNVIINTLPGKTPSGRPGVFLFAPSVGNELEPRTVGVKLEQQEWRDCGQFWLGIDTERPPTPADLQRPELTTGYDRELGDGQFWTCPVIREPIDRPNVPQAWGVGPDGEFTQSILAEYEWAWELSGRIWDVAFAQDDVTTPEAFAMCVDVLSLNYRLGPHECSRLQLLNTTTYKTVFLDAINNELLTELLEQTDEQGEWSKKNESDTPPEPVNSSVGDAAPEDSIDQPAPILS